MALQLEEKIVKPKRRRLLLNSLMAGLAALGLAVSVSVPASAATDLAILHVKNKSSVTGYLSYTEWGSTYSMSFTGYWTNHTASSAKLTSIRACSGYLNGNVAQQVQPYLYRQNGSIQYLATKLVPSTNCVSWSVNKTYAKQGDGELVRLITKVSLPAQYLTVGFFR